MKKTQLQMALWRVLPLVIVLALFSTASCGDEPAPGKPATESARKNIKLPGLVIDFQDRCVDVEGSVCLDEGMLELIACTKETKEHESIVVVKARPMHIHTALLSLGAKNGNPAMRRPIDEQGTRWIDVPPRGDSVDVYLVFKNDDGKLVEHPISDFVTRSDTWDDDFAVDENDAEEDGKFPHTFVFAGSHLHGDGPGPRQYLADQSGSVISISTFGDELLCLPGVYGHGNDSLMWQVDGAELPPVGSNITLRLRPKRRPDASVCPQRGTWSQRPATRWEDALVSGNGRMGVMVFGNPVDETLIANHCRLFLPLGSREVVPDLGGFLPELRKVIGPQEDYRQGMDFILGKAKEQGFPGIIYTDPLHPGMFVHVRQPAAGDVRDFSRREDFATGEVAVQWTDDRGRWSRRTFVSRADNAIVASFRGSAKLNCTLLFPPINPTGGDGGGGWIAGVSPDQIRSRRSIEAGLVTYHNVYTKGKGGFDSAVRVCVSGGQATAENDGIAIRDADEVVLLMRIVPWKTPLPKDQSEAWAYAAENPDFAEQNLGRYVACPKLADSSVVAYADAGTAETLLRQVTSSVESLAADYDVLFEKHVALHRPLFERVRLDLGASPDQRRKSSEQLLDEAGQSGQMSLALAEKIYDAGRYMFLCSAGELPPNLQGIWTGTWKPAWSGDFTLDTNVQLAMKHGLSGNYPELMGGYYRLMESFYPEWRLNAQRIYGADGLLTNARASNTALLLHWGTWPGIFWTGGCGWLARPFYEHYLYTGDRQFLEQRTVPFLEGVAAFYEDFVMVDETTGKIVFKPSFSPETGSCTSATMDVMVMRDVLTSLIAAYRALDIKTQDIPKWQALLAKLPDYRVNDDGALAEWIPEGRAERYKHRHLSHLHSAYEANGELGPDADPVLRAAAREAVRRRINSGGQESSHGRVHMGLAAAELDLAAEAYGRIEVMATGRSMAPSLMCTHEPGARIYNVDANRRMPEIMHRMLFRARPGSLQLLPALPEAWPQGQIAGVLAKGRITIVGLAWDVPARTVTCVVRSQVDQSVSVELPAFDPQGALTRSVALKAREDTPVKLSW